MPPCSMPCAARRTGDIEVAVAPGDAFPPGDQGCPGGVAAGAQVIVGAVDIVQRHPAQQPLLPLAPEGLAPVPEVRPRSPGDGQGRQPPPLGQPAGCVRDEAIDQRVIAILGHVDIAGPWIDAGRLVLEPAHGCQRHGLDQAGGARRHFEDPAMVMVHALSGPGAGLLARQPRAPGGDAPGTVCRGARQAEELPHDPLLSRIIDQGGCPAAQRPTVLVGVIGLGNVQPIQQVVRCAGRPEVNVAKLDLVIADQNDLAAVTRKTSHAVELARHQQAIVHGFTGLGEDAVRKALRQIQKPPRVFDQWPVTSDLVAVLLRRLRRGAVGQPRKGEGGCTGSDEVSARKVHLRFLTELRAP